MKSIFKKSIQLFVVMNLCFHTTRTYAEASNDMGSCPFLKGDLLDSPDQLSQWVGQLQSSKGYLNREKNGCESAVDNYRKLVDQINDDSIRRDLSGAAFNEVSSKSTFEVDKDGAGKTTAQKQVTDSVVSKTNSKNVRVANGTVSLLNQLSTLVENDCVTNASFFQSIVYGATNIATTSLGPMGAGLGVVSSLATAFMVHLNKMKARKADINYHLEPIQMACVAKAVGQIKKEIECANHVRHGIKNESLRISSDGIDELVKQIQKDHLDTLQMMLPNKDEDEKKTAQIKQLKINLNAAEMLRTKIAVARKKGSAACAFPNFSNDFVHFVFVNLREVYNQAETSQQAFNSMNEKQIQETCEKIFNPSSPAFTALMKSMTEKMNELKTSLQEHLKEEEIVAQTMHLQSLFQKVLTGTPVNSETLNRTLGTVNQFLKIYYSEESNHRFFPKLFDDSFTRFQKVSNNMNSSQFRDAKESFSNVCEQFSCELLSLPQIQTYSGAIENTSNRLSWLNKCNQVVKPPLSMEMNKTECGSCNTQKIKQQFQDIVDRHVKSFINVEDVNAQAQAQSPENPDAQKNHN